MIRSLKRFTKIFINNLIIVFCCVIFAFISIYLYKLTQAEILLNDIQSISLIKENHFGQEFINSSTDIFYDEVINKNIIKSKLYFNELIKEINSDDFENIQKITYIIDQTVLIPTILNNGVIHKLNKYLNGIKISVMSQYSTVYKIEIDSKFYILKKICDYGTNDKDLIANNIQSENIIKMFGSFTRLMNSSDKHHTWYLSEYLDVSLEDDYVINGDINVLRTIAADLLNALKVIHNKKIVHCDIFPRNVGGKMDQDGNVVFKLFDFGMALEENSTKLFQLYLQLDIYHIGTIINDLSKKMYNVIYDTSDMKDQLEDFISSITSDFKSLPTNVENVLQHPFITGKSFDNSNNLLEDRN